MMRRMSRILALSLALATLAAMIPVCASAAPAQYIALDVNTSKPLDIPATAIAYRSDDPAIATVDSKGVVTAYKRGYTYITAKYKKSSVRVDVYVTEPYMSYTDAKTFQMDVPSAWQVSTAKDGDTTTTFFRSPPTGQRDLLLDHFVVQTRPVISQVTKFDKIFNKAMIDSKKKQLQDFKLDTNYATYVLTLSGKKVTAYYSVYVYTTPDIPDTTLRECELVFIHKGNWCIIYFCGDDKDYANFYPEIIRTMESVKAW